VLDTLGMWDAGRPAPRTGRRCGRGVEHLAGLPPRGSIANVVVLGMGGSGIAGDVFQATAGPDLTVPVSVVEVLLCPPGFVGPASVGLRRLVLG